MTDYDNTNKGVIFPNKNKTSEKHPDYKGTGNFDGKEFEISVWKRTSQKDGSEFLSVSFQKPYVKPDENH